MSRILLLLQVLLLLLLASTTYAAGEPSTESATDDSSYFLGVAKIDVTPTEPVLLSGYAARPPQLTQEVSQRLWARCIAVGTDAAGPAVLMVVDNCGVPASVHRAVAMQLERLHGVPRARLTIASTHTHSGPMLSGVLNNLLVRDLTGPERLVVDRYTQELTNKLVTLAGEALNDRREVKLRLTRGSVDFAINRRGSAAVDHELPLIVASDPDGKPRAVITNYACHCVAAGTGMDLCGDWAGYAAEAIEREQPDVTALVLIGCGADQNPAQRNSLAAAQNQGQMLADEVRRLLALPATPLSGRLRTQLSEIALPLAELPSKRQWESRVQDPSIGGYHARKNLERLASGQSLPTEIRYPVQTWTFGDDLAMVFLGGEVVVDYVHRMRQTLDASRLWVTAYANDVACYIPSERVLREGGYEAAGAMPWYDQPAPLASGVEKLILDEVHRQLGATFAADHHAARTGGTRPLPPTESIAAMQTHDDLRIELVAAEPLVIDPVAIDFGHDGKLWVAEMHDYPEGVDGDYQPGGRIKVLQDNNGDGRYDTATTFLEGIAFPTGITVWRSGLLICAAPDVLYAEDTTGDGRADSVRNVLSGFHTENYQARVNSLSLGLDNWMHGAAGIFGGSVTTATGRTVDATNRDFRFRPDGDEVQAVSGRTQQGRARDDWGNWFGCSNSTLLMHYPTTDHYHRRNQQVVAAAPSRVIAASTQLFPRGPLVQWALSGPAGRPTAACGLSIYRDTMLGEGYAQNSFICEPVNQLVHRMQLVPSGVSFSGQRVASEQDREFLASSDRWFRPVQTRCGPDGAVYIVDMYRYMIEHPRFLSEETRAAIDVRAGEQMGRIYRVAPKSFQGAALPRLAELQTDQVVQWLSSANGTLRDMAHQQLLWRGDQAATVPLRKLAGEAKLPQVRLQALAVLDGLGALGAEAIAAALKDEHAGVRRHAVRLAETWFNESAAVGAQVAALASDEDPQVRLQVAYSLGEWDHPDAGPTLARMGHDAGSDSYIKSAVFSSFNEHNVAAALATALQLPKDQATIPAFLGELLPLAVKLGDAVAVETAMDAVVMPRGGAYAAWQWALMPQVLQALELRQLQLTGKQQKAWESMLREAYVLLADQDVADERRVWAIALLPYAASDPASLERLKSVLVAQSPVAVQQAAIAALAALDSPAAASMLLDAVPRLTPAIQLSAIDAAVARTVLVAELLTRLESGQVPRGIIDPTRRQQLVNHPRAEIASRAQTLLATPSSTAIAERMQHYHAVDPLRGDPAQGRELFVKHCAACHRVAELGHDVGPDLMALSDKSKAALLKAIIDPNDAIDQRYSTYVAVTAQGAVVTGIVESESVNSITLKSAEGKQHELLRSDLEELKSTGVSLMPVGLSQDLSGAQMEHLLAFLGGGGSSIRYSYPGPGTPDANYPDDPNKPKLTDGNLGSDMFNDGSWVGFRRPGGVHPHRIEFDLGQPLEFDALQIVYGVNHRPGGIHAPRQVTLAFSEDGKVYSEPVVASGLDDTADGLGMYQIARRSAVIAIASRTARYGRLDFASEQEWTFLAELSVGAAVGARDGDHQRIIAVAAPSPEPPADRRAASGLASVERMTALLSDVAVGTADEYRVIADLFRISIEAGRRNVADELRAILDRSLPQAEQPLRDWQAVVLGGGVVNGISQSGVYPGARVLEIIGDDQALLARWQRTLGLAVQMADDPEIRSGTRYDALRLVAMLPWQQARDPLGRYLLAETPNELLQGAVSGLADIPHPQAAAQLAEAIGYLAPPLRALAVAGLVRVDGNTNYLLSAVQTGRIDPSALAEDVRRQLLEHQNVLVRAQARQLLAP